MDKSILITGGSGSFGQAFVRHLLDNSLARRIVVLSRGEEKQVAMERSLADHPNYGALRFFIGDVRDGDRLQFAMRDVGAVVHAAALKHVPVAEYNPTECIDTNIAGTEKVIKAAIRCHVRRVIGLSTDKAVCPVNLYGATKLAAEKLLVSANNLAGTSGPAFSAVRYGNVFGSSGSVVPLFRKRIEQNLPLQVTDARMSRFWITMPQAIEFVIQSITDMRGGETFVPKIPSMRIIDLAEAFVCSVAWPHGVEVTGIRPGEKLHEMLVAQEEGPRTREEKHRYVIEPSIKFWHGEPREVTPMPDGWSYSSDTNNEWITRNNLMEMLE